MSNTQTLFLSFLKVVGGLYWTSCGIGEVYQLCLCLLSFEPACCFFSPCSTPCSNAGRLDHSVSRRHFTNNFFHSVFRWQLFASSTPKVLPSPRTTPMPWSVSASAPMTSPHVWRKIEVHPRVSETVQQPIRIYSVLELSLGINEIIWWVHYLTYDGMSDNGTPELRVTASVCAAYATKIFDSK